MIKKLLVGTAACLFIIGCIIPLDDNKKNDGRVVLVSATDPMNTAYIINNQRIQLIDGYSETAATTSSASKVTTSVFGEPVYGNIDGKKDADAAVILTYDPGGSGTFYYVAAAINLNGIYHGTQALLLGDRVIPKHISVNNGRIVVNYADHKSGDSMVTPPSINKSKHLILRENSLKEINSLSKGEKLYDGWLTIGHEVRSFISCSQERAFWLMGKSPALNEVMTAYRNAPHISKPHTPLFMTLAGKLDKPVTEGFGADYHASFYATQLVHVFPQGNCNGDLIYLNSPLPGESVSFPFKISGYARGKWFFEGDFPVFLTNAKGKVIAKGYATAKGEWMTERFVPFESVIEFKPQDSGSRGTLILKKDNPTDQPKFDASLEIPLFFTVD